MRKGFALITVLVILILIAMGTAVILQTVSSHSVMKAMNVQELQSQALAEAGMQQALLICRQNNGNCLPANGVVINEPINGVQVPITIITRALAGVAGSYEIKVCVDPEHPGAACAF